MEFKSDKPLYLQIADLICEKILMQEYKPEERILSVREMALQIEVNPNTVMRAYEQLQGQGIIENKRGIGYYVCGDAYEKVMQIEREIFFKEVMPEVLKKMQLLKISMHEIMDGKNFI